MSEALCPLNICNRPVGIGTHANVVVDGKIHTGAPSRPSSPRPGGFLVTPDEPGRAGRFWRAVVDTVRWMIRAEEGRSEWEARNR